MGTLDIGFDTLKTRPLFAKQIQGGTAVKLCLTRINNSQQMECSGQSSYEEADRSGAQTKPPSYSRIHPGF